MNGRINLPTPLTAVYGSTRPGTVYPAYDGTGLAAPATSDERLGGIPFLPRPPTVSEAPAPDTGSPPEANFDDYLTQAAPPGGAPPSYTGGYSPSPGYSPPKGYYSPSYGKTPPSGGYSPPSGGYYSPPSGGGYSPPSGEYSPPSGGYSPPSGEYSPPSGGYSGAGYDP